MHLNSIGGKSRQIVECMIDRERGRERGGEERGGEERGDIFQEGTPEAIAVM